MRSRRAASKTRHIRSPFAPGSSAIARLERRVLLAADLVISEFLASNSNGLTDSFGDHSDWIEIYNRGDEAAPLHDYYLTDTASSPAKWRFPVQSLDPGEYLVVFASDRNLAIAGQELHTNFKLGADGEYLGLMRLNGTAQFAYAPQFPAQSTDVSYGLVDETSPGSAESFFTTMTPGAPNVVSAAAPTFSHPSGTFADDIEVTLSSGTPDSEIRYTLDGTPPTASSLLYSGPLTISQTTTLRARAYAAGYEPSPVRSQSYIAVDSSISGFNSNLPVIVLDTFGVALNGETLTPAAATFIDVSEGYASMLDVPQFAGQIGLRIRGSSSELYPKKSFAFETWDEAGEDLSVPLLGMPEESDWILYAPYTEKSLMQNYLAFQWANEMGRYASRTRYVEVYVNNDGGGQINYGSDYQGVYLLMEKIKIDENRVDIDELTPGDNSEPNITGGYIWKKDRLDFDETGFTTAGGQFLINVEPAEEDITPQQQNYLVGYINEFESVLNGPNFADPVDGYAKYIDIASWIDHWIMVEMTKQIDGFRISTYFSKDRGGKIKMEPIWDYNLSLGNVFYNTGGNPEGWYSDLLSDTDYPYFRRLFEDPNFRQKLADRWTELRQTVFTDAQMTADIDAGVGILTDNNGNYPVGPNPPQEPNNPVVRNFQKWSLLGSWQFPNAFFDLFGRWIEDVNLMKNWLTQRLAWMDDQFLPAPQISPEGGIVEGSPEIEIDFDTTPRPIDTPLISSGAPAKALIPTGDIGTSWQSILYEDTGWLSGSTGVGFDVNPIWINYWPMIGLNVNSMLNVNASAYVRVPFNVADPGSVDSLILRMRHDDGFVAYLNGTEIARSTNVPEFPQWDSSATASRFEDTVVTFVEFDVTAFKNLLVAGDNVLAIHGMNFGAESEHFLIQPELVSRTMTAPQVYYTTDGTDPRASGGGLGSGTLPYTTPFTINNTTRVRARLKVGNTWSALAEELYEYHANSVRITEMMYNPAAGGSFGAQDYEFIELRNVGAEPVNLEGFRFTTGITLTLPDVTLAPGEYALVVKNIAAFQSRYGTGFTILGAFSGNLDNGGENIVFLDDLDRVVHSFEYDDAWYPQTDGPGYSLVIQDASAPVEAWGTPEGWRQSFATGGSPGANDVDTVAPLIANKEFIWDIHLSPHKLPVTFSEDVSASLQATDLVVTNRDTMEIIYPTSFTYESSTHTATFLMPGVLPQGNYSAAITASAISDSNGNTLGQGLNDFQFFVYPGDANHDRVVNVLDTYILASNWFGTGKSFAQGDFNYDGVVDAADLGIIGLRWLETLAEPVPPPPPAPPPAQLTSAVSSTGLKRVAVRKVERPIDQLGVKSL